MQPSYQIETILPHVFLRTKILIALPKNHPKLLLLLHQEMGSWRSTCSKTLREEK
jgi:hypothetical protein